MCAPILRLFEPVFKKSCLELQLKVMVVSHSK